MITQPFDQSLKPTFILVHRGWHGAWCWYKVVPLMKEKGLKVIAIDLPGHRMDKTPPAFVTLDDYANKVIEVANGFHGDVILLGHSSAGTVIAEAAERITPKKVSGLIFLDAFMPLNGESVFPLVDKYTDTLNGAQGAALAKSMIFTPDQKTSTLNLNKVKELLYYDCSETDVDLAKSKLGAQPIAPQATPVRVTDKNCGSIPKYHILCTDAKDFDKTKIASNVPCKKIYRLPTSHSPFFSMPDSLVSILDGIYKQEQLQ